MNNADGSFEVKAVNMTVWSVLGWILGILFAMTGIASLFEGSFDGIALFAIAALALPPVTEFARTRWHIALSRNLRIVIAILIIFFTASMSSPKPDAVPTSNVRNAVNNAGVASTTSTKPLSLEEQVANAVNDALGSTNNMGKSTVVKVSVDTYNAKEIQYYGYKAKDKINGVTVTINSSENLTSNLQRGTMANEAVKIFKAVFPLSPNIGDVAVWSQLPVKDKYGNVKDDTAITFVMSRPLYEKVNWANFSYRDLPSLLNSEKKTDDRNGSHELINLK